MTARKRTVKKVAVNAEKIIETWATNTALHRTTIIAAMALAFQDVGEDAQYAYLMQAMKLGNGK